MKFGVREIVDVVFKATENGQQIGTRTFNKYQPVFKIDTATTSSLEQATTTVYAQGGKGYARLMAWEGEKTMTFTVTDALMSPMGLAVLSGAGLIKPATDKPMHVHCTIAKRVEALTGDNVGVIIDLEDLQKETALTKYDQFFVCYDASTLKPYATKLDGSGAGIEWYNTITVSGTEEGTAGEGEPKLFKVGKFAASGEEKVTFTIAANADGSASAPVVGDTVELDFYLYMNNKNAITEVDIAPEDFGGYFYVEAQTLFRREDSGKDMAAEIIIPKAKIQSAFTFTMAASGDPSTFDFVMDAMPGYVRFDTTKKLMCKFQVLGSDESGVEETGHSHSTYTTATSPDSFQTP
jgi:hypothetical protein